MYILHSLPGSNTGVVQDAGLNRVLRRKKDWQEHTQMENIIRLVYILSAPE